jgi:hypothetical protein
MHSATGRRAIAVGLAAGFAVMAAGPGSSGLDAQDTIPVPTASVRPCLWGAVPLDAVSELVVDHGRALVITGEAPSSPRLLRRASTLAAAGECPTAPAGFGAERTRVLDLGRVQGGPLPLTTRAVWNSTYPINRNSGAGWDGAGESLGVRAGFWLRAGPVTAALAPEVHHSSNRSFRRVANPSGARSPYAYPWNPGIDFVQRYGQNALSTVSPGQSFVRADVGPFGAGLSTENLWLGTAQRTSLLISSTAPGFAHAFLETNRPVDVFVGRLGVHLLWGRLHESEYFDTNPDNDRRLFGALVVMFEPGWLPGLHLGAARVHHRTWHPDGMDAEDFIEAIIDNPFSAHGSFSGGGNQPGNSLGGVFARWVLPESGFETYFEWAREDYAWDLEDFLKEPDHARAYMLGFQKLVTRPDDSVFRFWGELTHLEGATASLRSSRGVQTFYVHSRVQQGHTHRGQLLGAWVGPGSTGQVLGVDRYTRHGRIGGYVERVRYQADEYWNNFAHRFGVHGYDVEITAAARGTTTIGRGLVAAAEVAIARRYNPGFAEVFARDDPGDRDSNVRIDLALSWLPGLPGS